MKQSGEASAGPPPELGRFAFAVVVCWDGQGWRWCCLTHRRGVERGRVKRERRDVVQQQRGIVDKRAPNSLRPPVMIVTRPFSTVNTPNSACVPVNLQTALKMAVMEPKVYIPDHRLGGRMRLRPCGADAGDVRRE
jgi:hypothetical protein